jgi:hypothetical protein
MRIRRIVTVVITAAALALTAAVGIAVAGPALANEVGTNGA